MSERLGDESQGGLSKGERKHLRRTLGEARRIYNSHKLFTIEQQVKRIRLEAQAVREKQFQG